MFFRLKSFFPIGVGRLHAYSKHPNIFKKMYFKKKKRKGKKRGGAEEGERKEKQVFCFVLFFSTIALAEIHIPGKSHTFVLN